MTSSADQTFEEEEGEQESANETPTPKAPTPKLPTPPETRIDTPFNDGFINEPLCEDELRQIFNAKCQDFKLKFNEKLFQRFIRRQKELSTSKILRMESCGFGPITAGLIVEAVFRRSKLRVVDVSDNFFGDDGAYCFADLIFNTHCIIAIDLSSNHMTDNGTKTIFTALRTNRSVSCLNIGSKTSIGRNSIGPKSILEITNMLIENKVVSELNLSMTELNSASVLGLCHGLSYNSTLTHLNLSNNNIKSSGAVAILKSLYHSKIIELRIGSNSITDTVAPFIAQFLTSNTNIRILDLSMNDIGYRTMSSFGGPLSLTCTLDELILYRNPLGGRGIAAFGPFLAHNHTLRVLNVNACQIDLSGFVEFCNDLMRNSGLQVLQIQHNPLTDEGVIKLSNAIRNHFTLREIDLEMVEMNDLGAKLLFQAIATTNIDTISIKNNMVGDGMLLQKTISSNQKLMNLDIDFNNIDYKMTREIMRVISLNQRRWRESEIQRMRFELNHMTIADIELQEARDEIVAERDTIVKLKLELNELENFLLETDNKKKKYIGDLEAKNSQLEKDVSKLMDECRSAKSDMIMQNAKLESEISQQSAHLAREVETFKTECKTMQVAEGKEFILKTEVENTEKNQREQYLSAKMRYLDAKRCLIMAWDLMKSEKEAQEIAKKMEAEAATKKPAEAETKKKASRSKNSKKAKGKAKSPSKSQSKESTKKTTTTTTTTTTTANAPAGNKKKSNKGSTQSTSNVTPNGSSRIGESKSKIEEDSSKVAISDDPNPVTFETEPSPYVVLPEVQK